MNLMLMGAETRAGRSTIDALSSFADRLGLDEARSFVATLRQSIELGSDITDALVAFSATRCGRSACCALRSRPTSCP